MFDMIRMFGRMVGRVPLGQLWYLGRRMRNERPQRFAGQLRVNSFIPPFPSPAFDRFCQAVSDRRRVPINVYLAVTNRCPFTCDHCSNAGRETDEMSTRDWCEIIRQCKGLGACTLGLTGGEPLLRDDLCELIAAAKPEMATVLFTTGQGLATTEARQLKAAGCDCITIGMESSRKDEHNAIRGGKCDSFASASIATEASQQAGLFTAHSTIGTRERLVSGELERMYEQAHDWGVQEFRVLAPVATGAKAGSTDFMLSPEERASLADFHVRHNRAKGGPGVASFAYLESGEMFGCGAGYHHLFIDATGEVCPCDLTPLSFGNARNEPLSDIWCHMSEHFPRPGRGCLMQTLAGQIETETLPLPPEKSKPLCPPPDTNAPLPEAYRRLL